MLGGEGSVAVIIVLANGGIAVPVVVRILTTIFGVYTILHVLMVPRMYLWIPRQQR